MTKINYINLACGPVFVESPDWLNLDFSPSSSVVRKANLLARLPVGDQSTSVVYSSHFIEHVPRSMVAGFLSECLRILKSDGVIRLVLPDLENMAREYLSMREAGVHDKADFVVLEMIDQCVRRQPGGELGRFYRQLSTTTGENYESMVDYVRERVGEDLCFVPARERLRKLRHLPGELQRRIERYWIRLCLLSLPKAFREQNVSLAGVGERHQWLWDFYQLRGALESAGFVDVQRRTANSSAIAGFPFHALDLDADARPRKGVESMYVEARKPG